MRRTLGTAVFAGMLGVTLFRIFLTPVFYAVIQGFGGSPAVAGEMRHEASDSGHFTAKVPRPRSPVH